MRSIAAAGRVGSATSCAWSAKLCCHCRCAPDEPGSPARDGIELTAHSLGMVAGPLEPMAAIGRTAVHAHRHEDVMINQIAHHLADGTKQTEQLGHQPCRRLRLLAMHRVQRVDGAKPPAYDRQSGPQTSAPPPWPSNAGPMNGSSPSWHGIFQCRHRSCTRGFRNGACAAAECASAAITSRWCTPLRRRSPRSERFGRGRTAGWARPGRVTLIGEDGPRQ